MAEDTGLADLDLQANTYSEKLDEIDKRTHKLEAGAGSLAGAMAKAFTTAVTGAKQLDEVLKGLALRLSDMALRLALQPLAKSIMGSFNQLFAGFGDNAAASASLKSAMGAIKPFAAGGVIGTPTYFPLAAGGVGLAGEAGPEAIMPLARGADGRLGVSAQGGAPANVTITIATPDPASFRRSEAYITGQIARAVARGQRGL